MTDRVGGQIDMMIEVIPSAAPQARAGRIKPLAVSTTKRAPGWPAVQTIAESGLKGFDVSASDAVLVPAGTPGLVIDKLNAAIRAALADSELRDQLAARGTEVAPGMPEELTQHIATNLTLRGEAVKRSGAFID